MDRTLTIHWRHSPDQPGPCLSCSDTKKTFMELLQELLPVFKDEEIQFVFHEETIPRGEGAKQNTVELNGIPLELLLLHAAEGEEYCHASKCLPIRNLYRQIPGPDGIICGEAPEILFRKAILLALEGELPGSPPGENKSYQPSP